MGELIAEGVESGRVNKIKEKNGASELNFIGGSKYIEDDGVRELVWI